MIPGDIVRSVLMYGSKQIPQLGVVHDMLDLDKIPVNTVYSMLEDDTVPLGPQEMQQDEALRTEHVLNFGDIISQGMTTCTIQMTTKNDNNEQQQQSQNQTVM